MGNCTSGLETIPIPGIDGNLDESSKELLLKALSSKENSEEIMRTLIASNVDVNHKLEYESIGSCYPLHIASKIGNANAVNLLLEGGADHSLTDSRDRTPLHWAVAEENLDVVDRLIEAHADVNAVAEDDITPLHLAIETNNEELVEKLLAAGADVSPGKGESPLVTAVKGDHVEVIMPLLKANASPVGLNFDFPEGGPTCMQSWATAKGHDEIAAFLKEKFPEEGAVSEMEKEINEKNEQREGGDGAEDTSAPDEAPLPPQPPESEDHNPEETTPDTHPEEDPPEASTAEADTSEKNEPDPPSASEPDLSPDVNHATDPEREESPLCAKPEQQKDSSDNEGDKTPSHLERAGD